MTLSARNSAARLFLGGLAVAAALLYSLSAFADDPAPGPQSEPKGSLREQLHLIPAGKTSSGRPWLMATNVFRPKGDGPFPLVVINHGSPGPKDLSTYSQATRWFVARGFAVALPTRRGYGRTGGGYPPDGLGTCASNPNYAAAGLATADDIRTTIDYMRTLPYVRADGTVILGQSAGGWGTIAAASRDQPGVIAMINFAGGRAGHKNCGMEKIVAAAARYGGSATLPMLWVYTENDSFFPPEESRAFLDAFVKAGGQADYHLLPPFAKDGHTFFAGGTELWSPLVEAYLKARNALPKAPD